MHAASTAYEYPLLIKHLLTVSMRTSSDQEIVTSDIHRYTYRDFNARLGRLAAGLQNHGIIQGSTVAIMDWDGHRYLEGFFGVPMMGAILHTINIMLSPDQILYTINHAKDDVILVHEDFVPVIEQIADRIEQPVVLILLSDALEPPNLPNGFATDYESLLGEVEQEFNFADFDESTVATTFYTTGTTGDPKGVYYSHRQIVLHTLGTIAGVSTGAETIRLHKDDVYMPVTPMFHVHAWGFPYFVTMLGLKQVYPGRYVPAKILKLFEGEGVTYSHCVPTILHMLLSAPEAESTDFSKLKIVIGGSALTHGLAKAAMDKGIQIYTGYGMSETCPVLTLADLSQIDPDSRSDHSLEARCKTGKPIPLVDLRVVDESMRDVPNDGHTTGEVVVRSPWLTQGYTHNPDGSEALWKDGYLHTGDVGFLDSDGSLQITDRMKDVIKSGGEWISSLTLETIASSCSGVGEVAAIGITDKRWGERPILIVVKSEEITEEQILDVYKDQVKSGKLSKWAVPDRVVFVESLDKTSVGKLDKKELRRRYG
jgi:fatty-acyl-CoA synthase